MVALISRVRELVNDPAGASEIFSDDTVQDALDAHRLDIHHARLEPVETFSAGGTVTYLDYYASRGDWEEDAELQDAGGTLLSPSSNDWLVGHWVFASSTLPPVFITGKVYDVYGAAADVLEMWAAKTALEFDFQTDGQSFKRNQKQAALESLANRYRRRAWPMVAVMVRDDVGSG